MADTLGLRARPQEGIGGLQLRQKHVNNSENIGERIYTLVSTTMVLMYDNNDNNDDNDDHNSS